MANVPSHTRTRTTHNRTSQSSSRRTHRVSAYLPAITGAEEVYEQILIDGVVQPGDIPPGTQDGGILVPGTLDIAPFAADIRPVVLVTTLPTLPNASFPIGSFVYKTNDSPARLYKNVADAWVAAIGPDDIQANSITAGQIAAGAVSTSELAVGARLTGEYANESGGSPGVFADSTGLLIRSGKLTLQDAYGTTSMVASGFEGSWNDFLGTGLYNSMWVAGVDGSVLTGTAADLPYWTRTATVGSPTLVRATDTSYPGGKRLRIQFSALNDEVRLRSDPVPIIAGGRYRVEYVGATTRVAGNLRVGSAIRWLDKDKALISTATTLFVTFTTSTSFSPGGAADAGVMFTPPLNARYAQVDSLISETGTHNSGNIVDIGIIALAPVPVDLDSQTSYSVKSLRIVDTLKGGGSILPVAKVTDDRGYRTDLQMQFVYDGSLWVCTCPHYMALVPWTGTNNFSATQNSAHAAPIPPHAATDVWIEDIICNFFVNAGTALSGSHKWVGTLNKVQDGTNTNTSVATVNIDSGSSSVHRRSTVAIDALLEAGTTYVMFQIDWTKTGTPGNLSVAEVIKYRFVAN